MELSTDLENRFILFSHLKDGWDENCRAPPYEIIMTSRKISMDIKEMAGEPIIGAVSGGIDIYYLLHHVYITINEDGTYIRRLQVPGGVQRIEIPSTKYSDIIGSIMEQLIIAIDENK